MQNYWGNRERKNILGDSGLHGRLVFDWNIAAYCTIFMQRTFKNWVSIDHWTLTVIDVSSCCLRKGCLFWIPHGTHEYDEYLNVTAVRACSNHTDLEGWRTLDCGCGLDWLIPWYGPWLADVCSYVRCVLSEIMGNFSFFGLF
jgi:hypothetical protein